MGKKAKYARGRSLSLRDLLLTDTVAVFFRVTEEPKATRCVLLSCL